MPKSNLYCILEKKIEIKNLVLMNLKENVMKEVNSWRFWWVLRVLGCFLKKRNKGKCFGHFQKNWIIEIFETKSVASMLQHWAHNVAASEMEENWQNSQCCSIEDSMPRHSGIKGDNVATQQTTLTSLHCGGQNMILKVEYEEVFFYKVVEDSKTFNFI